ncbi:hypothetical protein CC86DRAFT_387145 [Ophiobolus disseminans]|uniref:C2H2-domain containing protein second zinc finger domain-containing protein n=1 Tax=Ophiobolus disseminans TaxID=1469910 RepID=A0A6A6ZKE1_9PLEO|nr:hypothetical protein CC86DRAFT_387145 [Ophiobolus disseminans]
MPSPFLDPNYLNMAPAGVRPPHLRTTTTTPVIFNQSTAYKVSKTPPAHSRRRSQRHGFHAALDHIRTKPPSPRFPQQQIMPGHAQTKQIHMPAHVAIGIILSNGETGQDQYQCHAPDCFNKTFGRIAELKRHHAGKHAAVGRKPQFWCPINECERSKTGQGEAFPRKDKMFDHLSRAHANIVGS